MFVLFSLVWLLAILIGELLAMYISYVGSSVAVPTGRVYSILLTYDITANRRYACDRTVRSQTNGPFAGESI